MITAHNLGMPRIGPRRELKWALESYWRGEIGRTELEAVGSVLRRQGWALQRQAGMDLVSAGDFSFYDQVLDTATLLGAVPRRFGRIAGDVDLDTYFRMARGRAPGGEDVPACEMTKWFDTNYHYLVPELSPDQAFRVASNRLFDEVADALAQGHAVKPVLLGPLTFLWLAKTTAGFDRLALLDRLVAVYREVLNRLLRLGVTWVQIDEPILALDLPQIWLDAFEGAYRALRLPPLKLLLATYFGPIDENIGVAASLPVDGLHVDLVRGPRQLAPVLDRLAGLDKTLSLGVVDGRNVWRNDLGSTLDALDRAQTRLGERLWVAPSCSLLHCPLDLEAETGLDPQIAAWLAFARQKLEEVATLARALREGREAVADRLDAAQAALLARERSELTRSPNVRERLAAVDDSWARRASPYAARRGVQRAWLGLPLFPTTTIGSFPQTAEIRRARVEWRQGRIAAEEYRQRMREEIRHAIAFQETVGLDVLVHGEAERSDMVDYFAEFLDGVLLTQNGWVQSYGSRCVKPPIVYGDVERKRPMTVAWSTYAQSLTARPVKGMLTGPITVLQWSFVRDDQPRAQTCLQLALAIRDEVQDLEQAGVGIIQIDEPAFREGLPLRRRDWDEYLRWATFAFRAGCGGVADRTQIHTHMCYSEFRDILPAIADLDADVISIETARSDMDLLEAFRDQVYERAVGPGVYDIHSPRVPTAEEMQAQAEKALAYVAAENLWLNPDCGLKTRGWAEVEPALRHLVQCAHALRNRFGQTQSE